MQVPPTPALTHAATSPSITLGAATMDNLEAALKGVGKKKAPTQNPVDPPTIIALVGAAPADVNHSAVPDGLGMFMPCGNAEKVNGFPTYALMGNDNVLLWRVTGKDTAWVVGTIAAFAGLIQDWSSENGVFACLPTGYSR